MNINAILAHEYGYLDSKHGMGYEPRPIGFEKHYSRGYKIEKITGLESVPVSTYSHKSNWGWY